MFSSLKEKFLNVQEEITTSLRNLKLDRQGSKEANQQKRHDTCNYDAGLAILERYNSYWTDIHSKTEITALCAQEVDEIISSLHLNYETQWRKLGQLSNSLALLPQVVHGVQEICDAILNTQCAFDETEEALLMLEDLVETQELQEKQLEHRFQLTLYQKKRISDLAELKDKLGGEHMVKVQEFEKNRASAMKVRQAAFQEKFENDLNKFKLEGTLPKVENTVESSPSLEEIMLEDEDNFVLEEFLSAEEQELVQEIGLDAATTTEVSETVPISDETTSTTKDDTTENSHKDKYVDNSVDNSSK